MTPSNANASRRNEGVAASDANASRRKEGVPPPVASASRRKEGGPPSDVNTSRRKEGGQAPSDSNEPSSRRRPAEGSRIPPSERDNHEAGGSSADPVGSAKVADPVSSSAEISKAPVWVPVRNLSSVQMLAPAGQGGGASLPLSLMIQQRLTTFVVLSHRQPLETLPGSCSAAWFLCGFFVDAQLWAAVVCKSGGDFVLRRCKFPQVSTVSNRSWRTSLKKAGLFPLVWPAQPRDDLRAAETALTALVVGADPTPAEVQADSDPLPVRTAESLIATLKKLLDARKFDSIAPLEQAVRRSSRSTASSSSGSTQSDPGPCVDPKSSNLTIPRGGLRSSTTRASVDRRSSHTGTSVRPKSSLSAKRKEADPHRDVKRVRRSASPSRKRDRGAAVSAPAEPRKCRAIADSPEQSDADSSPPIASVHADAAPAAATTTPSDSSSDTATVQKLRRECFAAIESAATLSELAQVAATYNPISGVWSRPMQDTYELRREVLRQDSTSRGRCQPARSYRKSRRVNPGVQLAQRHTTQLLDAVKQAQYIEAVANLSAYASSEPLTN